MLDILVPETGLQRSRIDAVVCELVAGGTTQHVGTGWSRYFLIPAEPFHHAPDADGAHGCFALDHEHVTAGLLLTPQPSQGPMSVPVADARS